jgi:hypothetical protein
MTPSQAPQTHIGPTEFNEFADWVAGRCPFDLEPLVQKAGGIWEPGSKRWLVKRAWARWCAT